MESFSSKQTPAIDELKEKGLGELRPEVVELEGTFRVGASSSSFVDLGSDKRRTCKTITWGVM